MADRWQDLAACRGKTPRMFLGVLEQLAKETCARCPVQDPCAEAGRDELYGVWGGLAPNERTPTLRREPTAVCGTDSGYYRHVRKLKEPACGPCREAHTQTTRSRASRRAS